MAGILDVLRAAVVPAAVARGGYLTGEEQKRQREAAEAEQARLLARQQKRDAEEQRRYEAQQTRQAELDKQQNIVQQARIALERARAEESRSRGEYYKKGGSAGFRGSGRNGELTAKDRAMYIRMKSMPHYNPDTGAMEPGMPAREAAAEFDEIILGKSTPEGAPAGGDGTAARITVNGQPKYASPFLQEYIRRSQMGDTSATRRVGELLGNRTPPATRPDTAAKMAGAPGPSAVPSPLPSPAPHDSASLSKRYPFLFQP